MTETVAKLNELLEAERAGVETMSRLFGDASTPEMRELFEKVRDDEAWSCAGLARAIKRLGGAMSDRKGDFADRVMGEPSLPARLRLLNRGQGWVVKRLDGLLALDVDGEARAFLREMRAVHVRNVESCDALVAELDARPVLDVRALVPKDRHAKIFEAFERLSPGEAYVLVNDHDPKPLYYQFAAERAGTFTWQYLEQGPEVWRVEIGKVRS